jgi:hypothetical protein
MVLRSCGSDATGVRPVSVSISLPAPLVARHRDLTYSRRQLSAAYVAVYVI